VLQKEINAGHAKTLLDSNSKAKIDTCVSSHNINDAHGEAGAECAREKLKTSIAEAQNRCTLSLCPSRLNHTSRENDP
jgi:hypothetical protein